MKSTLRNARFGWKIDSANVHANSHKQQDGCEMDSSLMTIGLPVALGVVMMGLGLELAPADFARVWRQPRAMLVALFCQLVLLVGVCFLLVKLLALPPLLAAGMMLLAASPGGATANMFSLLFRGDVALNISLTAINSLLSIVTLPLIVNWALAHFLGNGQQIGLQLGKLLQVFAIILVPVGIGMWLRARLPDFATRMQRPVRVFAALLLLGLVLAVLLRERAHLVDYVQQAGLASVLFCALSLGLGYVVPRLVGLEGRQARAIAFEVGVHNTTLAMTIALVVLQNTAMAVPAAVYSLVMYGLAALFGWALLRESRAGS